MRILLFCLTPLARGMGSRLAQSLLNFFNNQGNALAYANAHGA